MLKDPVERSRRNLANHLGQMFSHCQAVDARKHYIQKTTNGLSDEITVVFFINQYVTDDGVTVVGTGRKGCHIYKGIRRVANCVLGIWKNRRIHVKKNDCTKA